MSPLSAVPDDPEQCSVDEICTFSTRAPIHNLFLNGTYSDITIICGGREFKAHRAIVCTQCLFFENAFTNAPKKRMIRKFTLPDGDPEVFQRFLEFLYTGSYTVEGDSLPQNIVDANAKEIEERLNIPPRCPLPRTSASSESSQPRRRSLRLKSNAEPTTEMEIDQPAESSNSTPLKPSIPPEITLALNIYLMADNLEVPALKLLARDRFYTAAKEHWVTRSWKDSIWEETQVFEEVVLEVFISTRPGDTVLWKALCKLIAIKEEDDMMKKRMDQVMKEHVELAEGVLAYEKEWDGKN
ncbi:hypothetical protein NW762_001453 [Fusarium torreyae]|uniref:BTB domain-containing protein n=1 Tax=Fusarium torreyae TaxID=1237075 RepID=A0A9W8SDA8_9HYPO|nr:hypothetical protein NW762_001453 [Fusarium torreyae]